MPTAPFAWPWGHGILRRFSSPGGEGMKTQILDSDIAGFVGFDAPTHILGSPGRVDPTLRALGSRSAPIPRRSCLRAGLDDRDG